MAAARYFHACAVDSVEQTARECSCEWKWNRSACSTSTCDILDSLLARCFILSIDFHSLWTNNERSRLKRTLSCKQILLLDESDLEYFGKYFRDNFNIPSIFMQVNFRDVTGSLRHPLKFIALITLIVSGQGCAQTRGWIYSFKKL